MTRVFSETHLCDCSVGNRWETGVGGLRGLREEEVEGAWAGEG